MSSLVGAHEGPRADRFRPTTISTATVRTDVVVYRPSNGAWYILKSSTNFTGFVYYLWGQNSDIPVPGDFDGDGRSDVVVYRPSNAAWYILQSSTNFTGFVYYLWGQCGDISVLKRP